LRSADQGSRQYRYQYDANNRLTRLTDPTGTPLPGLDFAYDAQGRQIRKGSQTRSFDGANRITAIDGETYAYDGNGRRIATWAADGRTKVEVYTQNGQLGFAVDSKKGGGSSFVYLAGQRIAEDHWNCGSNSHTATYYHADALGSPVATTDAARNVLERTYYAPYGEALNRTVDGPGYTGHVMDAATGLVYAQQRYYDPLVGKFLSVDPVAADPGNGSNFNRYWYANNNPYKFTDPTGRAPFLIPLAIIAYKAYSAADTVTSTIDNAETIADPNATTGDKALAGAEIAGSVIGGKLGRNAVDGVAKVAEKVKKTFFSKAKRLERFNKADGKCEYCGKQTQTDEPFKPDSAEGDHFIPQSKGGTTTDDNLVNACRECNGSGGKGDKLPGSEFQPTAPSDDVKDKLDKL
ncbi:MAG: hypothetical protein CVV16_14525, partial [Gammaproteobacteria bacterium HGW-Gammaproteobacteria-6]